MSHRSRATAHRPSPARPLEPLPHPTRRQKVRLAVAVLLLILWTAFLLTMALVF